jgi:hypothetical protein
VATPNSHGTLQPGTIRERPARLESRCGPSTEGRFPAPAASSSRWHRSCRRRLSLIRKRSQVRVLDRPL